MVMQRSLFHEEFYFDKLIIIDIEGNGQSPSDLVEIGCLKINSDYKVEESKTWLVKPLLPITNIVQNIHGISNDDVKNKPYFSDIKEEIICFLQTHSVIGHHVGVDYKLLKRLLPNWSPIAIYDTLPATKKLFSALDSYKLTNLIKIFEINENMTKTKSIPHRVDWDVFAVYQLLLKLKMQTEYQMTMMGIGKYQKSE